MLKLRPDYCGGGVLAPDSCLKCFGTWGWALQRGIIRVETTALPPRRFSRAPPCVVIKWLSPHRVAPTGRTDEQSGLIGSKGHCYEVILFPLESQTAAVLLK